MSVFIRRSNGGNVVEVGIETVSPGRNVDRRVLAGDLDQVLAHNLLAVTVQPLGQTSHTASIDAGIPDSVFSSSGKAERRSGRPRRLRQDMRWRNDCGASARFSYDDSHA